MQRFGRVVKTLLILSLGLPVLASFDFGGGAIRSRGKSQPDAAVTQRLQEEYGRLALSFEKNEGQTDPRVAFLSRGHDSALFLLNGGEAVIALNGAALRLKPVGAHNASAEAREPLPGAVNYVRGTDQTRWRYGISTYARVAYTDIYPGVDLVYYGNKRQLEYDFVVRPGADPRAIVLEAEGADRLEVDALGDLVIHVGAHQVRQQKPIVYQEAQGVRHAREGRYSVQASNRVTFEIGAYDSAVPLVIDPVLVYSTYLGGARLPGASDTAAAIAVDASGHAYVTGATMAADFPTTAGAFDTTFSSPTSTGTDDNDAFVTKLDPSGASTIYSTFLGGVGVDLGRSIAIDQGGAAFVAGETNSRDFPTTAGAFDRSRNGGLDAFVLKLNASGTALVYSTLLGGNQDDHATGVAVDTLGDAYVVGGTVSFDFPTTAGAYDTTYNPPPPGTGIAEDLFVSKLDPSGASLSYSTFVGGDDSDYGRAIAVDASSGQVYVTGRTFSPNFPTTAGAFDTSKNLGFDAFVVKLDALGTALVYSTFLGGSDAGGEDIVVNSAGNAYVVGRTGADDFPTTIGAYDTTYNGNGDLFVTKLDPAGATVVYSTFFGGGASDDPRGIALDAAGQAHVVGVTDNTHAFPTTAGAFDTSMNGLIDVFVFKLSAGGSTALYSTLLGGDQNDVVFGIAVDQAGNAYVAGETKSSNYPTTAGALDGTRDGNSDGVVTKLNPSGSALAYSTHLGGNLQAGGIDDSRDIAVDSAGSAYVVGRTSSPDFPTTLGTYNETANGDTDVFVTKLDPSGAALVYSTFIGGMQGDSAYAVAVDATGQAYVAGETGSTDFPTTVGAYDTSHGGITDVFVTKLDASGASLSYSTFVGGASVDRVVGIAVDASGQVHVTGDTASNDFPTTVGAYNTGYNGGQQDVFVTKLNAAGAALIYSTFLGSSSWESAHAIAVDALGGAYVTGETVSASFPTTAGAYDVSFNGGRTDIFVTKLGAAGSALVYSTFIGGGSAESGKSIAVDSGGNAYVAGLAASTDFPTTAGAFDTTLGGGFDAFVMKLDGAGSTLVYSTLLGGNSLESAFDIAVDGVGNAFLTGYTYSPDFPATPDALDPSWNFSRDAFVTKIDAAGVSLLYSTFLGGISEDEGSGLALDAEGSVYVTGYTTFTRASFPTTPGAYDRTPNGGADSFVAKFGDDGPARPRAIVTANGSSGPVTLTAGNPLNVRVAFDLRGAAPLNPAEVYFGVYTQLGQFWWDPATQKFGTTPTPLYAGPLGSFGPSTVVNLPNAGVLTPGPYLWFVVVDNDSNGQPNNEFFESVLTTVQ